MSSRAGTTNGLSHPLLGSVILLLIAAILIFAYTIIVGILNGLDLVDFSRELLLAHLHGGTLGWMTLGIMAATFWLFAGEASRPGERALQSGRGLAVLSVAAIALYVVAFATTFGMARPLAGVLTLLGLIGVFAWTVSRVPSVTLTVPRLFVLVGLGTSIIGGSFGVLNGLAIARGWGWVPESFFDAHPGTMEVGFIIPVAMGLAEWGLRRGMPDERATRAGLAQVGFMFVAFLWVLFFILAGVEEMVGAGVAFAIVGLIIFYFRMWPIARTTSLLERAPGRHAVAAGVFIGAAIVYLFVVLQMAGGDFDEIPRGQLLSFIHLMSVGGTTNALFAFTLYLARQLRPATVLDDVVFWGVCIGVTGFVVALSSGVDGLIHLFVPLMGVALLVAIVVHGLALAMQPINGKVAEPSSS